MIQMLYAEPQKISWFDFTIHIFSGTLLYAKKPNGTYKAHLHLRTAYSNVLSSNKIDAESL